MSLFVLCTCDLIIHSYAAFNFHAFIVYHSAIFHVSSNSRSVINAYIAILECSASYNATCSCARMCFVLTTRVVISIRFCGASSDRTLNRLSRLIIICDVKHTDTHTHTHTHNVCAYDSILITACV